MQIIVLGMHRSGTSLVTRMINMMGAYVGPEGSCGFNKDNPKGYWERQDAVRCNASLLKMHSPNWAQLNVTKWIGDWQPPAAPDLHLTMKNIILNMDAFRPWVMKDPHLCITLPHWKPLLEVPVCVIVYRDPLEIAQSLCVRKYDAVPSLERGIALWEHYAVSLLNVSADLPKVFVSHSDFIYDPVSTTAQLYHGLAAEDVQGLRLPSKREITAFVDPTLYRSKPKTAVALTAYQQELAAMMRGDYPAKADLTASRESMLALQHPSVEVL